MLLAWALLPVVGNAIYWFHATRMLYEAAPAWIAFATLAAVELGRSEPKDTALAARLRAVGVWTFVAALLAAPVWGIPTRWSTYSWTDETLSRIVLPEPPGGGPAIVFAHSSWNERISATLQGAGDCLSMSGGVPDACSRSTLGNRTSGSPRRTSASRPSA